MTDLTNTLLTAKLADEIIRPTLKVSDADVAQYSAQREAKNKEIEAYNAGLRPKIEGLLKQIKEGTNFADIAFTQSDCSSSYEGGEWGTFKRGDIRPEITDAAFKMEEGALSDIVETPYSYHILKLIKKNLGFVPEDSKEPAPVISVKIAHIMLEKKERLPTLNTVSAKSEILATREKEALGQLKERLIKAAKIVTPLPLY
jgi:parvulin-like peptidyl-prolyl isomerase